MDDAYAGVRGLHIAHLIECDGPGGAETVVAQIATTLQAAGAHNVVFLPADGEGWLAKQLAGTGVTIEYFRVDRPVSPACARSIRDAFRRHQIAVAHSHEFSMAVYGAWASWRCGIPHIITMHGRRYYADRFCRRVAMRLAIAGSARTVAVSTPLAGHLRSNLRVPSDQVLTVPNGVRYLRPERVTLRDELRLAPADRLIVSVGNLYPVKGHAHLVDAMALLMARHPTLHLAISGRGELEGALLARARERGVEGRLHLLGLRSDVPAVLAAADIFALPSLSEGLPLALLEAMFAGCPIVATQVGEVPTTLAHGKAGLLVKPADAAALAAALDRLLSDSTRARTLGDRAAAHARAEYDLSRTIHRYVGLYEAALVTRAGHIALSSPTRLEVAMRRRVLSAIATLVVSATLACGDTSLTGPTTASGPGGGQMFAEDFESGTLDAWQDGINPALHRVVRASGAQSGSHYLAVTFPPGRDGGWLSRFFLSGDDSMYVSYYVRFPPTWRGGTKLVAFYGSRTEDQWSGMGKAGICPKGTDYFAAMLLGEETGNPGPVRFYTYYPAMRREPDGVTCWGRYGDGSETYVPPLTLTPNVWHRIEFWVQLNTPGQTDGRQAFWIDGTQRGSWSGISFRDTPSLRLNAVQLVFSVTGGVPGAQELHVDNLEVRSARP